MYIKQGSGPKKCIRCLRSKDEAIKDHIKTLTPCDNPDCPFRHIIEEAIEIEKNKPKFSFGSPQKPKIRFGEKTINKIRFGVKRNT